MNAGGTRRARRAATAVVVATLIQAGLVLGQGTGTARPAGTWADESPAAPPDAPAEDRPLDLLVVVNPASRLEQVSKAEVEAVYLGRRTAWSGGDTAVPIHSRAGSELRAAFVRRVLGMEPADEITWWQAERIRTGRRPPVEFSSPLRAVFSLRDGVGYVFRKDYRPGTARIVLVVREAP